MKFGKIFNFPKFLENFRKNYQEYGIENFYKKFSKNYINPHEPKINRAIKFIVENWDMDLYKILDLAAGSGEVTRSLMEMGYNAIEGADPFTFLLYEKKTGKICHKISFDNILLGKFKKKYSTIICSFALHLADESKLPMIIWNLSIMTKNLIILSPHKKPIIKENWGLNLYKKIEIERIKITWYKSIN